MSAPAEIGPLGLDILEGEAANEDVEKGPAPERLDLGHFFRDDMPSSTPRVRTGAELTDEEKAEIMAEAQAAADFKRLNGGNVGKRRFNNTKVLQHLAALELRTVAETRARMEGVEDDAEGGGDGL